ncbi:MAG: hypothetical protein V1797_13060 [Pseudomonadota bacterium]
MSDHDQNHGNHDDDDVEEFEYHCFDSCENYPDGCKNCDQVMHEGYGQQDKDKKPPEKK